MVAWSERLSSPQTQQWSHIRSCSTLSSYLPSPLRKKKPASNGQSANQVHKQRLQNLDLTRHPHTNRIQSPTTMKIPLSTSTPAWCSARKQTKGSPSLLSKFASLEQSLMFLTLSTALGASMAPILHTSLAKNAVLWTVRFGKRSRCNSSRNTRLLIGTRCMRTGPIRMRSGRCELKDTRLSLMMWQLGTCISWNSRWRCVGRTLIMRGTRSHDISRREVLCFVIHKKGKQCDYFVLWGTLAMEMRSCRQRQNVRLCYSYIGQKWISDCKTGVNQTIITNLHRCLHFAQRIFSLASNCFHCLSQFPGRSTSSSALYLPNVKHAFADKYNMGMFLHHHSRLRYSSFVSLSGTPENFRLNKFTCLVSFIQITTQRCWESQMLGAQGRMKFQFLYLVIFWINPIALVIKLNIRQNEMLVGSCDWRY